MGKQDRLSNSIQRIYWITAKKVRTPPPSWQMPFKIFIISFEPFPNKRLVPGTRGNRQFSKIMGCWDLNHFRNFGFGREYKSYVCALSDSKQDETLRKPKTSHNKVFQSLSFPYSIWMIFGNAFVFHIFPIIVYYILNGRDRDRKQ